MVAQTHSPHIAFRRSTRSSSAAAASSPPKPLPAVKSLTFESSPPQPNENPLLFPGQRFPLTSLLAALPTRRPQILELLRLVGLPASPPLPILLYGGHAVGKTRAILLTLRHLRRPFAYASCRSCPSPKLFFESILSQLLGHSASRRCEKAADFIPAVHDAILSLPDLSDSGVVYLVFDNLELMRSWDKGAAIVSLLLRLHDLVRLPQIGYIYVTSATPDAYHSLSGSVEPIAIYFPDYTVEQLQEILVNIHPHPKLYSSFLSVVLKPFFRITRRVDELVTSLEPLFQVYCEPVLDLDAVPDEGTKRRLFDRIRPHLAASLNDTFVVPLIGTSDSGAVKKQVRRKDSVVDDLEFHMSISAKYLLISAFLASRNPATLDAALFDSTGGSDGRKRKRRSSQADIDRKDHSAEESLMKGPGTFPLERLLAIFQCIMSVSEDPLTEQPEPKEGVAGATGLMSDALLQLSTLCESNFILKSSSCPLEGTGLYRTAIDEDTALKVARSVGFPLSKYLYRR